MARDDDRLGASDVVHSVTEHRQRRKRWFYVLPAIFVTFSLAYLDRANYGLGAAAGLAETLHITGSQSALLGSLAARLVDHNSTTRTNWKSHGLAVWLVWPD